MLLKLMEFKDFLAITVWYSVAQRNRIQSLEVAIYFSYLPNTLES